MHGERSMLTAPERVELEAARTALAMLIEAGEAFIAGAGSRVEVDLDYCQALAGLEEAVVKGKRVCGRAARCLQPGSR